MALGEVDYGLMGVVGGLAVLIQVSRYVLPGTMILYNT